MNKNYCPRAALTRREFLQAAGVIGAGLLVAGCQPGKENPTSISPTNPPKPTDAQLLAPTSTQPPASAPTQTQASSTLVSETLPVSSQPTVAIARIDTYDRKLIRQQVQALMDNIGGLDDILKHGNRVAIKTNLTGGTSVDPLPGIPEIESYLTHPEVVRAMGELLLDSGVTQLFIVEAVYEKESWRQYGYEEVAKSLNATLVDLNDFSPYSDFATTTVKEPLIYDKFTFNPILNEVDAFVSVAKMKCHNTCGVTHAMKNLVGLVPYRFYRLNTGDAYRSGFHGNGNETKKRLPRVVMDLNRTRPVTLALIDGIMTTEGGEGPWIQGLAQLKPGVMFAGKDPVATDAVATAAMGFDPTIEYPKAPFLHAENHLNIARELGLGTNRLEEIRVVGPTVADVMMKFKPSY